MTDGADVLNAPLLPSREVVARRVAGEYLLVPVRTGAAQMDFIYTANDLGSRIFQLLDGRRNGREIARMVSEEFDVQEPRALEDIARFLEDLVKSGLVHEVGSAGR